MRIQSPEHSRVLRKGLGILGATLLTMSITTNNKQNHSPPERVYAQAEGVPAIIQLLPGCIDVSFTKVCATPTTEATTTTTEPATTTTVAPPPPPTTEAQPLPTPDTAPPEPSDAAPMDSDEPWQAPEGCMEPMGPTQAKSIDEAHYCWDGLLARFAWPQGKAFDIMYCESSGNPYADNPNSTANGLMQILDGPSDPYANVSLAHEMYVQRGWQPWVCA